MHDEPDRVGRIYSQSKVHVRFSTRYFMVNIGFGICLWMFGVNLMTGAVLWIPVMIIKDYLHHGSVRNTWSCIFVHNVGYKFKIDLPESCNTQPPTPQGQPFPKPKTALQKILVGNVNCIQGDCLILVRSSIVKEGSRAETSCEVCNCRH